MKVDSLSQNIKQINNLDVAANKQTDKDVSSAAAVSEKIDRPDAKVDLSNTSVDFSRAAEEMDKVSEERINKIEELKNAVRNDTYHVDSEGIAEKIVDDALSNI